MIGSAREERDSLGRRRVVALALTMGIAAIHIPARVASGAEAKTIAWSDAAEHVGKEVVVEGRVGATHATPTAVLLSFHPQFAGLTVVIFAPDFPKFPTDPARAYKGRKVRVSGTVEKRYGRLQIVARSPEQIKTLDKPPPPPPPTRPPPPPPPPPSRTAPEELAEVGVVLELLSRRLELIEARLAALEEWTRMVREATEQAGVATRSVPQIRTIHRGLTADDVRATFGPPERVTDGGGGYVIWSYGPGSSVTFDPRGRVKSWAGFR